MTAAADAPDRIVAIDLARCALPLERPVQIGRTIYHEREYVAVRLAAADGTEGHAIGYTRGLPLDAMVGLLANELLGARVSDRESLLDAAMAAHVNAMGSLVAGRLAAGHRARGRRRAAGGPAALAELGGTRARVPLMVVAGYHASERGADAVVAEVRALLDAGFRSVKLHTDRPDGHRPRPRAPAVTTCRSASTSG